MQTELAGGQTALSSIFCVQQQSKQQKPPVLHEEYVDSHDIAIEIKDIDEQIHALIQEIRDEEELIASAEASEFDMEPEEEGEECIFDTGVPQLEEDLRQLKYEHGQEIERLEKEKKALQWKLIGRGER